MKFRTKIWMLPACAALVFLAGVVASFWVGARTSADLRHLSAVDSPFVEHMLKVERGVEQFRLSLQSAAAEGDADKLREVEGVVAATHEIVASMGKLEGKQGVAANLKDAYDAYRGAALGATRAMLSQQDPGDQIARMQAAQTALTQLVETRLAEAGRLASERQATVASGVRTGVWAGLITGVVVLLVLGAASWLIVSSVWKDWATSRTPCANWCRCARCHSAAPTRPGKSRR
jgi:methyl-accepting chemotaxis protein